MVLPVPERPSRMMGSGGVGFRFTIAYSISVSRNGSSTAKVSAASCSSVDCGIDGVVSEVEVTVEEASAEDDVARGPVMCAVCRWRT